MVNVFNFWKPMVLNLQYISIFISKLVILFTLLQTTILRIIKVVTAKMQVNGDICFSAVPSVRLRIQYILPRKAEVLPYYSQSITKHS